MALYAARPSRRLAQVVSDLFTVVWAGAWWFAAQAAAGSVRVLAEPARATATAAESVRDGLHQAGAAAGRLPAVGDDLRRPLDDAAAGVQDIVTSASAQVQAIEHLSILIGVIVFCVPVLLWVLMWLPRRVRFVRNAAAGARFVDSAADLDLFALRAMATLPLATLALVSDDPVQAWRDGDRRVIDQLAALALDQEGLPRRS